MIRYSNGPLVDLTYTNDGSKANIISHITQALINAGWTAQGSSVYQSATTPQGFKIRVSVLDDGTATVHLRLQSPTVINGGLRGKGGTLLPVNNRTFRIMANQYQLFHFASGTNLSITDPCDIAFGVPYIPPFIKTLQEGLTIDPWLGWMIGNGVGEPGDGANSQNLIGFRCVLPQMCNVSIPMWIFDTVAFWDASGGDIMYLIGQTGVQLTSSVDQTAYWDDGTLSIYEPYITWPAGHGTFGNWSPQTRHGQLWDALMYGDQMTSEVTRFIDSKTWRNVTQKNPGTGGNVLLHSLFLLSRNT